MEKDPKKTFENYDNLIVCVCLEEAALTSSASITVLENEMKTFMGFLAVKLQLRVGLGIKEQDH